MQPIFSRGWMLLAAFAFCVLVIALTNYFQIAAHPRVAFFVTLAALALAMAVSGMAVNGRPAGIVIDNRNRVSLSKFQATLWTLLVITALVTVASHNLAADPTGAPLSFDIPAELLAAMGISAASLVATPLALSLKTGTVATADDLQNALGKMEPGQLNPAGKVFGRADAAKAEWADMLRGEEVGNAFSTDLSKVQQLFISLLLVGIYGMAVLFRLDEAGQVALPPLQEKFVWLLAVSHASYISYKAAPHTKDG